MKAGRRVSIDPSVIRLVTTSNLQSSNVSLRAIKVFAYTLREKKDIIIKRNIEHTTVTTSPSDFGLMKFEVWPFGGADNGEFKISDREDMTCGVFSTLNE